MLCQGAVDAWEMCWVGLMFKGQGPGLTKIHFPSAPPLTHRLLHGQNSIESKPEDGLEHGNIVFGCKQLCQGVSQNYGIRLKLPHNIQTWPLAI